MDKLPDIKILFENAKKETKDGKVKIARLHSMLDGSNLTDYDFNEFFKDFINRRCEEVSAIDFDKHLGKIEKALLELCLGKGEEIKDQSEYVASNSLRGEEDAQDSFSYFIKKHD